jgi:hypothetical protein
MHLANKIPSMVWRLISAAILLFWAVMTGLIIRNSYFPDSSRFASVAPKLVFDLFLNEAAAFNNTLHLYHELEKTGHANFTIRRLSPDANGQPIYALGSHGAFDTPGEGPDKPNNQFRINAELDDAERWRSFDIEVINHGNNTTARVRWKRGDAFPDIEIKRGNQIIMNSQMAQAFMALQGGGVGAAGGGDWLSQFSQSGASDMVGAMQLHAREGIMDLAGKQRHCYIISAGLPGVYEAKIYFTEVGELARIELPQDYRLLEPMMHGLEPELNTVE